MKRVLIAASMLAFAGIPYWVWGQDDKKKDKEAEEIIIRKNGDKEINMKVEINGDKIIVNGKPLAEFKDDQITINKRKMIIRDGDKMMAFDFGPGGKTFNMGDGFMKDWSDDKEETAAFLGVTTEKTDDGAKITEVVKESAAEKAGLKKDDVLTEVGGKKISNTDEAREQLQENKEKAAYNIKAKRNGSEMSFDIKIPKKLKTANL